MRKRWKRGIVVGIEMPESDPSGQSGYVKVTLVRPLGREINEGLTETMRDKFVAYVKGKPALHE